MSITLVYSPGICSPVVMPLDDAYYMISSVAPLGWNVSSPVSSQANLAWKVKQQRVSSQAAIGWNDSYRVKSVVTGLTPGLCSPVVHPIDWKYSASGITWNIDKRISSKASISWKTTKRVKSSRAVTFDTLTKTYSFDISKWNVLQRVHKPGVAADAYYNGIVQPVVHPIDSQNSSGTPNIAWNIESRIRSTKKTSWNVYVEVKKLARILWNTLDLIVQIQKPVKWNTLKSVTKRASIKWNTQQRPLKRSRIAWNTFAPIVSQHAIKWDVKEYIRVLKVLTTNYMLTMPVVHPIDEYKTAGTEIQWNTSARRSSQATIRYNTLVRKSSGADIAWDAMYRVTIPDFQNIYYPGILQPVVHPITLHTNPWNARIEWRVGVTSVTSQAAIGWSVHNKVSKIAAIKWNTSQRSPNGNAILWNTCKAVTSTAIIEWNVGQVMPMNFRQTSVSRQDFAY